MNESQFFLEKWRKVKRNKHIQAKRKRKQTIKVEEPSTISVLDLIDEIEIEFVIQNFISL